MVIQADVVSNWTSVYKIIGRNLEIQKYRIFLIYFILWLKERAKETKKAKHISRTMVPCLE